MFREHDDADGQLLCSLYLPLPDGQELEEDTQLPEEESYRDGTWHHAHDALPVHSEQLVLMLHCAAANAAHAASRSAREVMREVVSCLCARARNVRCVRGLQAARGPRASARECAVL